MEKGIKFHSIYFRYFIFVLMFAVTSLYVIAYHEVGDQAITISFGKVEISMTPGQFACRGFGVLIALSIILSFTSWKFSVGGSGIYIKKIDLLVPWDDINSVAHVWVNEYRALKPKASYLFYNRKSLIIYRKELKPICIYNISVLSLYVIKLFKPQLRSNILSASLATLSNVLLNGAILYEGLVNHYDIKSSVLFMGFIVLYLVKSLFIPLAITGHQNAIHGKLILHDTAYKRDGSKAVII